MKRQQLCVLALLLIFSVAAVSQRTSAEPTPRVMAASAWEHLAMPVKGDDFKTPDASRKIIELGAQGWELVDVETYQHDGTTSQTVYFFKRQKSD